MPRPAAVRTTVLATLASLLLAHAATATSPSDLCTGNPCEVSGPKTVAADSLLDFPPGTNLVFKSNAVVTLAGNGTLRSMVIRATTITLEAGAKIAAATIPDSGTWGRGFVILEATGGDLRLLASGSSTARIDVRGNWAGGIELRAARDLLLDGPLLASGIGSDAYGGEITLSAGRTFRNTRELDTSGGGGEYGQGGPIAITAEAAVAIDGVIDASGGGFDGGDISIYSATGGISTSQRIESTGAQSGSGGSITLEAPAGPITLSELLRGNGSAADDFCGDGSSVTLTAGTGLTIAGGLTVRGGSGCSGGTIEVTAGGAFLQASGTTIHAGASGTDSTGGELTLVAGGDLTLRGVDLSGIAEGGTLSAQAALGARLLGAINARATGSEGSGGAASIAGCTVEVPAGSSIDTRGDGDDSGIEIIASGAMTIAGTLRSSTENRLAYLSVPPVTTGATIVPPPILENRLSLLPCSELDNCGNGSLDGGELCDDGNLTSCDGCNQDCDRIDGVCGDGIRECGEQCDDGNTLSGDGCESNCTLPPLTELMVQGSPLHQGCQAEWKLFVSNGILDAQSGLPKRTQKCTDGDPACDRDGANNLQCAYEAQICLRVDDPRLSGCLPAALKFVRIGAPSPFSSNPLTAQNGQAILNALLPFGLDIQVGTSTVYTGSPFTGNNACSETFTVRVPRTATSSSKRNIRIATKDLNGARMKENEVSLVCNPNPAVCGNGVVELFEHCDDLNATACDGCSPACRIETCGNGRVECGEECDAGTSNGAPGSPCTSTCTEAPPALRIPGGGSRSLDCGFEWAAALPATGVLVDRSGLPRNTQRCTDGDSACDLDPTPGSCRMRLWACLAGADARIGCAAQAVTAVDVSSPRPNASGTLLAARGALLAALTALGLPTGPGEACTHRIEVEIPAGKTLRLATRATFTNGRRDADSLKLSCRAP